MPAASDRRTPRGRYHFEHRHHEVLPMPAFLRRLALHFVMGGVFIAVSLAIGMAGYAGFEGKGWTESFLNASMILSGMGPMAPLPSDAAKIFAGLYALYSGLAVLAVAGLVFAPLIHRLLHRFHVEDDASPAPTPRKHR